MKRIGITVYDPQAKNINDHQLQWKLFDNKGSVESGTILQSKVFEIRDDQTFQVKPVIPQKKQD